MCMICTGLKRNKLTIREAQEKYEEFLDLDLIDEDHQEEVESLIAEHEENDFYWNSAKKDYLRGREDYDDDVSFNEELASDEDLTDDLDFDDE